MAFKNFIKKDSYTTIDNVNYNKTQKTLNFFITCYEDSTKKKEWVKLPIEMTFQDNCEIIKEYYTSRVQLKEDILGFILSPAEPNGYFTKRTQKRVESDGKENILEVFEEGLNPLNIYIPDINSYMKYDSSTKMYKKDDGLTTKHFWDENLSPEKMKTYNDILEFCYVFAYRHVEMLKGLERC